MTRLTFICPYMFFFSENVLLPWRKIIIFKKNMYKLTIINLFQVFLGDDMICTSDYHHFKTLKWLFRGHVLRHPGRRMFRLPGPQRCGEDHHHDAWWDLAGCLKMASIPTVTIWLFNIAMENGPFIDGLPIKNGDVPFEQKKYIIYHLVI